VVNLTVILTLLCSGLDIGGRVGIAFPTGGVNRTLRSGTTIGLQAGYSLNRHRLELGYSYFTFPGQVSVPYELRVHDVALAYDYEFLHRMNWGISAGAGAGYSILQRSFNTGRETGRTPDIHLAMKVIQHEGKSRVSAGLDNIIFMEGRADRPLLTYIPMLRVEVGYAF